MIANEREYHGWIKARGVGSNDRVACSPESYISYLNAVSEILGIEVSAKTLSSESDVARLVNQLRGRRSPKTINNYRSAMRQYVAMVAAKTGATPVLESVPFTELRVPIRTAATEHSTASSYREVVLEHLFIGELMRQLWLHADDYLEVLKPQVDNAGYDLVLEAAGSVRHVQLKSSHDGASTAAVNVNMSLALKPSGCVIWLWFKPATLEFTSFLWFGSAAGEPLPDLSRFKVAKHTKGNAQGVKNPRLAIRVLPKSCFQRVSSVGEIIAKLF